MCRSLDGESRGITIKILTGVPQEVDARSSIWEGVEFAKKEEEGWGEDWCIKELGITDKAMWLRAGDILPVVEVEAGAVAVKREVSGKWQ
jgi:hypothetical protein